MKSCISLQVPAAHSTLSLRLRPGVKDVLEGGVRDIVAARRDATRPKGLAKATGPGHELDIYLLLVPSRHRK